MQIKKLTVQLARLWHLEFGQTAAAMYTLLVTARLNGVDPQSWLADVLDWIAQGHPINGLDEPLP